MTRFNVAADALHAEARYETDRAGVIDGLAAQVQRARASEDCFGLIGQQAGFFSGYDEMVNNVEENIRDAAEFLRSVAERLEATADHYDEVDKAFADIFKRPLT